MTHDFWPIGRPGRPCNNRYMVDRETAHSGNGSDDAFNSEQTLIMSGLLVTVLVVTVASYTVSDSPVFLWVCALSLLQVALFFTFVRSSATRTQKIIFWAEAIVILGLIYLVAASFIIILTVVWIVQSVELYGPRRTLILLITSLVLFTAAQFRHYGVDNTFSVLTSTAMYSMLQLFALSVVQRFIGEREQKEQVAALNRELIATRQLLSQTAAQSERLRIARDLHDILGHHMTALILNLEVASHSVEGTGKEKVEQSLALAKLLLGDLRSTVSELRDDSAIDLESSITQLVSGIPNFTFTTDFDAAPVIDNLDVAETLLRCTQEAITNVLRHSSGDHGRISLRQSGAQCVLTVADNGKSESDINPGNGLNGMRERVVAQGGTLNWQHDAQGFKLEVALNIGTTP